MGGKYFLEEGEFCDVVFVVVEYYLFWGVGDVLFVIFVGVVVVLVE